MSERVDICKDIEKFKLILSKLIQKLYLLEEEFIIIDKVKIKQDDTFLKKIGYYQADFSKTSKKNLESLYSYKNKENNFEQIEGLKKNLGVINSSIKTRDSKTKFSKKKLKHFPFSFKSTNLFSIEDTKQMHSCFKTNKLKKKDSNNIQSNNNLISEFEKDIQKYLKYFETSIKDKNKEQLIQILKNFNDEIIKKFEFKNFEKIIQKWISKINKADTFCELNANFADLKEIFSFMKQELSKDNAEIINYKNKEENEEKKLNEGNIDIIDFVDDNLDKEEMVLFNQLKQFNVSAFVQPRNPGFTQHKFKLKIENIIKESNDNNNENLQENKSYNYNFVDKISTHIILSQNFRTKKNKLIGYSYPFKEDTILNNCNIF
jgi:hypothetical protein